MKRFLIFLAGGLILFGWSRVFAEEIPFAPAEDTDERHTLSLPYGFYNDSFGWAVAYVYSVLQYPEKQSALMATAMVGTKGSAMVFLMGRDIRVLHIDRLFLDPILSSGYFKNTDAYISGNPDFSGQQAGSNDSNQDNFITGNGWDNYFRLTFKYLLPVGYGKDHLVNVYRVQKGLLVSGASGGESWNPIQNGKTFLQLRPFYRSQQINSDDLDTTQRTNGFDLSVFWDNRDFQPNPSRGNSVQLKVSRDFGWLDSSNSWTMVGGEMDKYFSLGSTERFRQRVIALDVWTAVSPTWEVQPNGTIDNRPPTYAGATLGGLWRMRGYPSQRFSDKAGIYYGAEYRLIPDWNPFPSWPWLQQYIGIQWVQFVPFIEAGRVAPAWSLGTLHSHMKFDAGFGTRLMAKWLVVRLDLAVSSEGGAIQMMVSQPFQF
jgi:Omp85 superfamily domain